MDSKEHADLEAWAQKFGGTAILGFISTLLLSGKFLHHILQKRGLIFGFFVIPPALISGLIGLVWFCGMEYLDPLMTTDLRLGLEAMKGNLINFVFAALILGITCGRANSQHNSSFRGIVTSLFHEGMPMVIYSQLLNWGQTTCCLLFVCISNSIFRMGIPSAFAAMVPLGIEAGADIVLSSNYNTDWTSSIVEEAESLGLLAITVSGVLLFSYKSYFISQGWLGKVYLRDTHNLSSLHMQHSTGQAEAFSRHRPNNASTGDIHTLHSAHPSATSGQKSGMAASRSFSNFGAFNSDQPSPRLESPTNSQRKQMNDTTSSATTTSPYTARSLSFDDESNDLLLVHEAGKTNNASLGAHLALIALTAFMSFGLSLSLHLIEIELKIDHHWLSGVRMFKLTMCCAMACMLFILQHSTIKFNRDWFMHMCGLLLDLLVIAALSKARPQFDESHQTHYFLCGVFVMICVAWNAFCFLFVARSLFPNYWFERALTLAGDSMGHSYTGLLFVRTLDPSMESPVPAAYAYKLLLFFIPSSGAKQTIVSTTIRTHGVWAAFFTCLFVVFAWLFIFDAYFRRRFITNKHVKSKEMEYVATGNEDTDPLINNNVMVNPSGDCNDIEMSATMNSGSAKRHRSIVNHNKSFQTMLEDAAEGELRQELELCSEHTDLHTITNNDLHHNLSTNNTIPQSLAYDIHCSETSSIVTSTQMNTIASFLPPTHAAKNWVLTYSLRQHGASLTTLLAQNAKKTRSGQRMLVPCVILIEDSWGYVFGGFIAPLMQNKQGYYGNGESFVFSVVPTPRVHKWTGKNELFVLSNPHCFAMGGGGEGYAIQLDDELDTGVSNKSDTFNNNVLSSSEFFKCLNVEVWMLNAEFSV
eukprot:gene8275-9841_t